MKRVTVENYREDALYPRIVRACREILLESEEVTPVAVLIPMQLLSESDLERWRRGQVPYLEKVIRCNLTKAGRLLRILRMHAHDLKMGPKECSYTRRGSGRKRTPLRFSRTGDPGVEQAYSRHFVIIGCPEKFRARKLQAGGLAEERGSRLSPEETHIAEKAAAGDESAGPIVAAKPGNAGGATLRSVRRGPEGLLRHDSS